LFALVLAISLSDIDLTLIPKRMLSGESSAEAPPTAGSFRRRRRKKLI
jgi:hypothetical protein